MSLQAQLLVAFFRLIREKRTWTDPRELEKEIRSSQQPKHRRPPKWMQRRYRVEGIEVAGFRCWTIGPRQPGGPLHVLHLHGGGYIQEIAAHHWRFFSWLVDRLGCRVTVPIYPLAPEHHASDTVPVVRACYDRALQGVDPAHQVLMGDSAGGGLAVGLARQLHDEGRPLPGRMVLISPWLDVTMSDPSIAVQDRRDPYLGASGLAEAGRRYAGETDVRDPRVSPLFGALTGLPPTTVFIGTRDVLLSDARRLRDRAQTVGGNVEYLEYPGMIHNWPMRRIPEGRRALHRITEQLASQPGNAGEPRQPLDSRWPAYRRMPR